MFTTGSKLYLGLTAVALAILTMLGWATGWAFPVTATIVGVAVASALIGGVVLYGRDVTAWAKAPADAASEARQDADAPRAGASLWPLVAAFGAALTVVGLVVDRRLFLLGLAFAAIALVEWVVQDWSERASADPAYNRKVRGRLLHPLEFPILGALVLGLVLFGFSRVMLAIPDAVGSTVVFIAVATLIFTVAIVLVLRPSAGRVVLGSVLGLGAIAALAGGAAGVGAGEREFEHHETASCAAKGEEESGSKEVSSKAGVVATITLSGGAFDVTSFSVPRATYSTVIFVNDDEAPAQLVIGAGDSDYCTDLIDEGKSAAITFRINTPGTYTYEATGTQASGTIVVP
jgi:hypothetical protein